MVTLQRILRWTNAAIIVAVLVALAAGYWYLWRPLPAKSGSIQTQVAAPVTIARDALGIPHITASSVEDALFAQGWATAEDRLWQMDLARRAAAGEVSEVAGGAGIAIDLRARRMRLWRIANEQARRLPEHERAQIAAYARGVNAYIDAHRNALPIEFRLMDYTPRPWRVADTLLVALTMNHTLTESWEDEIKKWKLQQEGAPQRVERLFPVRTGGEVSPGSNAWAIAGARSKTGKPILANDPHLDYTVPATWHAVHLKAPGLNVVGVTLPGAPGVLIGHNERVAWGITALLADTEDVYVERMDPRTGQYALGSFVRQARREEEWIAVRNAPPQRLDNWVTEHGPVVQIEQGRVYTLRWAGADTEATYPALAIDAARNWDEFRAALRGFTGPGLNFLYADVDGNIGHQVAGRLPARRGFAGDVPLDGATAQNEWTGYVDFDALPSFYNPRGGALVSANQNPFPIDSTSAVGGRYAAPYRQRQILARLASRDKWTPEQMTAIQRDVYSAPMRHIASEAARAARANVASAQRLREAIGVLSNWNGQMTATGAAPMLAELIYQQLRRRIGEVAAPRTGATYADQMAVAVVESFVNERGAGWFANWDATLIDAFTDAFEEAGRMQGHSVAHWNYGRMHQSVLRHPLAANLGWLDRYFSVGVIDMDGDATTVRQIKGALGPSMRFIATPANWDDSRLTLTTGESGQVLSGHYKDQWTAYRDGGALRLEFTHVDARSSITLRP